MPTPVATPAGIAAVQDILKEVFPSDRLQSQLYEGTLLLDFFDEVTEYTDSDGLKASVPLKVGRSGGISARGIGQQLGPADHQKPGKAYYNYKNLYATCQINGPLIAKMATQRQACVREIAFEVEGTIDDFKRDLCRQLHGDGSAALTYTTLPGNSASTTIALGTANAGVLERGFIYEGQNLDVGTLANPVVLTTGITVTSVDDTPSAPTVTTNTSITPTSSHYLFLYGNRTAADGSYEINGLAGIVSASSVLGGIDPTAVGKGYWKSYVDANGGTPRAMSLDLLNTCARKVRQKGKAVTDVMGDLFQQQKYYNLLQSQVRFAGDASLSAGKVEGPQFNDVTFMGDPDSRPGRVYFLVKSALQMYSAGAVGWQNQTTGGDILAWKQDYDAFVARAAKYCEVGTDRRPSFAVATDLATS